MTPAFVVQSDLVYPTLWEGVLDDYFVCYVLKISDRLCELVIEDEEEMVYREVKAIPKEGVDPVTITQWKERFIDVIEEHCGKMEAEEGLQYE